MSRYIDDETWKLVLGHWSFLFDTVIPYAKLFADDCGHAVYGGIRVDWRDWRAYIFVRLKSLGVVFRSLMSGYARLGPPLLGDPCVDPNRWEANALPAPQSIPSYSDQKNAKTRFPVAFAL